MSSELINIIENLNPSSFEDYKRLSYEIREKVEEIIDAKQEENKRNKDKDESQEDLARNYRQQLSINYIVDKFNIKILQFVRLFFTEDELIRDVLQKKPSIEQEVYDKYVGPNYRYFYSISTPFSERKMSPLEYGPPTTINEQKGMNIIAAMSIVKDMENNFKKDYYTRKRKSKRWWI
ncbi:MAG: hypothetical protein COB12_10320 [Flavobacterium sp.]|nr:MAG: hypothetical protein COB12_10320 [Flavobacterium sp.]